MTHEPPLATVGDGNSGRDARGRFGPGNRAARGNPLARQAGALRATLYRAVTPDDLRDVIMALLAQAKAGEVSSIKELLQRLLGPPEAVDIAARLDALEQRIAELQQH